LLITSLVEAQSYCPKIIQKNYRRVFIMNNHEINPEINNETLSKSAQSVQDVLTKKGISTRVVEMPASTRTAQDAANAIGCEVAQIVKSLIFCTKQTKKPILVLASGVNRVNEKAIEKHVGQEIGKADADFTREVTGFAIGGIPPGGQKQQIQPLIDQD
jgi:prolyl-tRNA editing enzyme YbaK/EbsC (Cys-tRNA(Pro) deacylase)